MAFNPKDFDLPGSTQPQQGAQPAKQSTFRGFDPRDFDLGEKPAAPPAPTRDVGMVDAAMRGGALGLSSLRRGLDLAAGGIAGIAGAEESRDRIFRESDARWEAAKKAAGPQEGERMGELAKGAQTVGAFASQAPLLFAGPAGLGVMAATTGVNRTTDDLAAGVDTNTALAQGAIEAGSTVVGIGLPAALTGGLRKRLLTGAAINMGQDELTRQASNAVYGDQYKDRHREFSPGESGAQGVIGATVGAVFGKRGKPAGQAKGSPPPAPPPAAPPAPQAPKNLLEIPGFVGDTAPERTRTDLPGFVADRPLTFGPERPPLELTPYTRADLEAKARREAGPAEQAALQLDPVDTRQQALDLRLPETAPEAPIADPRQVALDFDGRLSRRPYAGPEPIVGGEAPRTAALILPDTPQAPARADAAVRRARGEALSARDLELARQFDETPAPRIEPANERQPKRGFELRGQTPEELAYLNRRAAEPPPLELEHGPDARTRPTPWQKQFRQRAPMYQMALDLPEPTAPRAEVPEQQGLLPGVETPLQAKAARGEVTRGDLIKSLNEVTPNGVRLLRKKDGQPSAKWLGEILQAKDPVAAIRDAWNEGTHPRADILDAWHQKLTGRLVSDELPTARDAAEPNYADTLRQRLAAEHEAKRISTDDFEDVMPMLAEQGNPEGIAYAERLLKIADDLRQRRETKANERAAQAAHAADLQAALSPGKKTQETLRANTEADKKQIKVPKETAERAKADYATRHKAARDALDIAEEAWRAARAKTVELGRLGKKTDDDGNPLPEYAKAVEDEKKTYAAKEAARRNFEAVDNEPGTPYHRSDAFKGKLRSAELDPARPRTNEPQSKAAKKVANRKLVRQLDEELRAMAREEGRPESDLVGDGLQAVDIDVLDGAKLTGVGLTTRIDSLLARAVARVFGTEVVFFMPKGQGDLSPHGAYMGGNKLLVNIRTPRPYLQVAGHEFLHRLRAANEDAYQALVTALRGQDKSGRLAEVIDDGLRDADGKRVRIGEEEVVAEVVSDRFLEPKFYKELAELLPESTFKTIARHVIDAIDKLVTGLQRMRGTDDLRSEIGQLVDDMGAARKAVAEAVKKYVEDGTFSSDKPVKPLFDRADNAIDTPLTPKLASRMLDSIRDAVEANTVEVFTDRMRGMLQSSRGVALRTMPLNIIRELYGKELPAIKIFEKAQHAREMLSARINRDADDVVFRWSKLDENQARKVAEVSQLGTIQEVFPDRPLTEQPWLTTPEQKQNYNALRAKYAAMTPEAQKVYADARDMLFKHWERVHQQLAEQIESMAEGETKAAMLKGLKETFGKRQGPYFPLMRFGEHVVVSRKSGDPADYKVEFAESRHQAMAMARESRREGYDNTYTRLSKEFNPATDGVAPKFMKEAFDMIGAQGLDASKAALLRDGLTQVYLKQLPAHSAAKRALHRRNVAGYDKDAQRAFASAMRHASFYEGRLTHGDDARMAVEQLREQADALQRSGGEDILGDQVANEIARRYEASVDFHETPISDALSAVGYTFHLGLSPSFLALNLLQNVQFALPQLGARFGYVATMRELSQAFSETAAKHGSKVGENLFDVAVNGERIDITVDPKRLTKNKNEQAAIQSWLDAGRIDQTMTYDLAAVAEGHGTGWKTAKQVIAFAPHHIEIQNRITAGLAGYRLAKKAGWDEARAVQAGEDAITDAHFLYSTANKPYFMNPKGALRGPAKVLTLFKNYAANAVYQMVRAAHTALKDADPAERAVAAKELTGMVAMTTLLSGAAGLPLMGTVMSAADLVHSIFGDKDKPFEAETWLRTALTQLTGSETVGRIATKGLPAGAGIDISDRVGLGDILWRPQGRNLEGRDALGQGLIAATGPVGGIAANMADATRMFGEGNYLRGFETMMPKVIRDLMRAHRVATDGVSTTYGTRLLPADKVTAGDAAMQAVGFPPAKFTELQTRQAAVNQYEDALNKRKQALTKQYGEAVRAQDPEAINKAVAAIRAFNDKNPEDRLTVSAARQSLKRKLKDEGRRLADPQGIISRRNSRAAIEYGRMGSRVEDDDED